MALCCWWSFRKYIVFVLLCVALFRLACGMGEYIHGSERETTGMYNVKALGWASEPAT